MRKLRAAIIGIAHVHAITMIRELEKNSDKVDIVGIADYPPFTQEELEKRLTMNTPSDHKVKIWNEYKELLQQHIDMVVVCSDIKDHADIVEETLGMNIHTIVEKPMALDMADAKRMYRAYKKSSAELIISWPIAWLPAFRKVKELADSGIVGGILRVQYRSPSTKGPYKSNKFTPEELSKLWWYQHDKGGGSICDYAGYGCVLTTWITGKIAKKVYGLKKNFLCPFSDIEDYSTFTIDFGDCVGLIEGSWSTINSGEIATGPIVYGNKGVIVADRYTSEVKVYKDLVQYQPSPAPNVVYQAEPVTENVISSAIEFIINGVPLFELITPEFNMKAQAAFDAGRRSCDTGKVESVIDPFQI
jgi:glucose-fructose oxidoreductase